MKFLCSLGVILASLPAPLLAQEGGDHAAHHGGGAAMPGAAAGDVPPPTSPAPVSPMNGMGTGESGGMGKMMGEMMGETDKRTPFISQLLSISTLDQNARSKLATQASARTHQGLQLISEGSSAAAHAATAADQIAAARNAISNPAGEPMAVRWFRDQLVIDDPENRHDAHAFGLSPSHLLLMIFLALLSASLVALQLMRLGRIRKIVSSRLAPALPSVSPVAATAQTTVALRAPSPTTAEAAATPPLAPSNAASPAGASLRKPKSWTGPLRVVQIVRETPTIQTFRLADPSADRLPFDFLPGQFLQVEVEPNPGKAVRRSYTIASSPTQRAYVELTVKREEQGAVSRHLHDAVKVGDLIKSTGPFGAFTFTGTDAESIVLIAGGVGITPMMSVLRYLTDTAWPGEIFFIYGARSTDEFVFREELERLERRFANLRVFAAMQRSPGTTWLGPQGPITKEMLLEAVPDIGKRRIHLCGPPGMMTAMGQQLATLGVPDAQIHTEAFGPASMPSDPDALEIKPAPTPGEAPSKSTDNATADVAATTVTFSVSGVSAALPADQTVLEAAEGAGVEIPYACRVGECGVCVTKLLSGEVSMEVEKGLAASDKASGYILACQAKSKGDPLVVEA